MAYDWLHGSMMRIVLNLNHRPEVWVVHFDKRGSTYGGVYRDTEGYPYIGTVRPYENANFTFETKETAFDEALKLLRETKHIPHRLMDHWSIRRMTMPKLASRDIQRVLKEVRSES